MAIHSSIFTWKIPWIKKPGGLQSVGLQSRHNLVTKHDHEHHSLNQAESLIIATVLGVQLCWSRLAQTRVYGMQPLTRLMRFFPFLSETVPTTVYIHSVLPQGYANSHIISSNNLKGAGSSVYTAEYHIWSAISMISKLGQNIKKQQKYAGRFSNKHNTLVSRDKRSATSVNCWRSNGLEACQDHLSK